MARDYRLIGGKKFWRVACGFDKVNANKRAALERREGHLARVVKRGRGEYSVLVNYDPYKREKAEVWRRLKPKSC